MPEKLKYSIDPLSLLKNSKVSDALYDKIDWLAACSDMKALPNMLKWKTVMNQLKIDI